MDFFNPLDSMCEVVMEESDDGPVTLPSDDGNFDLPPIPTFDLQSEQFTYLPPGPSLQAPPVVLGNQKKFPIVEKNDAVAKIKLPYKPPEKRLKPKEDLVSSPFAERATFLGKLFNPLLFGKVFSAPDEYPKNLQLTTVDEMKYYSENFSDNTSKVELCRLHCTICDKHLGCAAPASNGPKAHRMLSVLVCKNCFDFYGDGIFPTDKSDNTEVYCRWCGQGGDLVCCSFCPKVFCYKCVKRNFDTSYLKQIQDVSDWACFCCSQTPLWPLRAVCRALLFYLKNNAGNIDKSICCAKKRGRKSVPPILPKPSQLKEANRPGPVQNPMVVFHAGMTKYGQNKSSPSISGTSIQRGDTTIRAPRRILPAAAALLPPLRGLPPARPLAARKPPQVGTPRGPQPMVRVPPRQVPSRMPEVYVDHTMQEYMVVRLRLPNNKDQYLRVNVTGSCMRIPTLPPNSSFPTRSLKDAFRTSKMAFSCLMSLKDKSQGSKRNDTEQAEALLTMLERWKSAIGFIEDDLKHNLDIHRKKEQQKTSDVIDLDDEEEDEKMQWNFDVRSKDIFDEDSEVEIIDDDDDPAPKKTAPLKRKNNDKGTGGPPRKITRSTRLTNGQPENSQDGSKDLVANTTDDGSGSKTVSADEGDDSVENVTGSPNNSTHTHEISLQGDADDSMDGSKQMEVDPLEAGEIENDSVDESKRAENDTLEAGEVENSNDSHQKEEGETEEAMEEGETERKTSETAQGKEKGTQEEDAESSGEGEESVKDGERMDSEAAEGPMGSVPEEKASENAEDNEKCSTEEDGGSGGEDVEQNNSGTMKDSVEESTGDNQTEEKDEELTEKAPENVEKDGETAKDVFEEKKAEDDYGEQVEAAGKADMVNDGAQDSESEQEDVCKRKKPEDSTDETNVETADKLHFEDDKKNELETTEVPENEKDGQEVTAEILNKEELSKESSVDKSKTSSDGKDRDESQSDEAELFQLLDGELSLNLDDSGELTKMEQQSLLDEIDNVPLDSSQEAT